MTTIKVNPMSMKSITNAQKQLSAYKESLKDFPKMYAEALNKRFEEILGEEAPAMADGMWSSYVRYGDGGEASGIIVFDQSVEFIEFGTGIVGKKNHADINMEWLKKLPPPYTEYNAGPMIHHYEDENKDYWAYFDGGKWNVTHGIAADPFIYRSVRKIMEEYADIARNVFGKNLFGSNFGWFN